MYRQNEATICLLLLVIVAFPDIGADNNDEGKWYHIFCFI